MYVRSSLVGIPIAQRFVFHRKIKGYPAEFLASYFVHWGINTETAVVNEKKKSVFLAFVCLHFSLDTSATLNLVICPPPRCVLPSKYLLNSPRTSLIHLSFWTSLSPTDSSSRSHAFIFYLSPDLFPPPPAPPALSPCLQIREGKVGKAGNRYVGRGAGSGPIVSAGHRCCRRPGPGGRPAGGCSG